MISYDIIHPEPAGGNGKLEQLTEIPLKNKKIKNNKVIFTDYTLWNENYLHLIKNFKWIPI